MQKSREGYGKNWTHFVSKLDNLFRSIRVSDENSSVTWALHFFKLITTSDFLRSVRTVQSDVINFQNFLTSFAIFQPFTDLFRELNDVKLKITTKWTLKMSKLGMVLSFHPYSMWKRVERVTAKTRRTSCTNWTISFGVSGFRMRTHPLHGNFLFLNLF